MAARRRAIKIGSAVLVCGATWSVFYCVLLPGVTTYRFATRYTQCRNNLHVLAVALHNYHDAYSSFPPSVVRDDGGHALYSWRVLLLPFLDEEEIHSRFHLDEPWNSEANYPLIRELESAWNPFNCPSRVDGDSGCSYVAVVGDDTVWRDADPVSLEELEKVINDTILLVEVRNSGIAWSEPRDLMYSELTFRINDSERLSPSSAHETCIPCRSRKVLPINVVMVDGSVRRLPETTVPEALRDMLTIRLEK